MAAEDAASNHLVVVACHIAALVRRVAAADILRTVHHIVVAAADDERRADDKGLDMVAAAAADRVDVVVGSAPADTHPRPCLHHQTNHLFPFSKQQQQQDGSEKNRIPGEKKFIEYDSTSIYVFTHVLQHMDDWDPYQ